MKPTPWMAVLPALSACALVGAAEPAWVVFTDPGEHAFTMQVPQGWKVTGGAYRFGPLDPRAMVELDSPDGQSRLRFGDAGVPPYAVPDRSMLSAGFREGSRYSPNGVAQEVVANYRPGWVFADLYGQARFASACRSLELKQNLLACGCASGCSHRQHPRRFVAGRFGYLLGARPPSGCGSPARRWRS